MNTQDDKERVRNANDIVDVVSEYVALKAAGKNFKGLCPFHKEKTPSFMVSPDRQSFKCFGCGAGGDVFEFMMRHERLSFPETMQRLAQRGNVSLTPFKKTEQSEAERLRHSLYPVMAWAIERFQQALGHPGAGKKARAYLKQRKLEDAVQKEFGLGFAPAGWDNLLRAGERDHYSTAVLEKAGLLSKKEESDKVYDRFRNRIIFPIYDLQGRPVALGGRLLGPGEPKYLNSPETPIFHKGEMLYALHKAKEQARSSKRMVLTEGYMDVIACHSAGLTEAIATLGTSLTPQQARLIKRYVDQVILLYDMDEAGVHASLRAFELLHQAGIQVRVVTLDDVKDPDEYIKKYGAKAFNERINKTQSMIDYALSFAVKKHGVDTVEGKIAVVREVGPLVLQFPKNGIEQGEYIHVVAEQLRLTDRQIITELERLKKPVVSVRNGEAPEPEAEGVKSIEQTKQSVEEELIVATLLQFPMEIESFRDSIHAHQFSVPEYRSLMEKVLAADPVDPDDEELWYPSLLEQLPLDLAEVARRLEAMDRGTENPEQVIRDCLNRLKVLELQDQLTDIQFRIKEIEKTGDMEALKQLAQEKIELAMRVKQFGVIWK